MNDRMKYRLTEIQKIENMKTLEKSGSIEQKDSWKDKQN